MKCVTLIRLLQLFIIKNLRPMGGYRSCEFYRAYLNAQVADELDEEIAF